MSRKHSDNCPFGLLKNESARQRWELFHRAIAHAKQCNQAALREAENPPGGDKPAGPLLSVIR